MFSTKKLPIPIFRDMIKKIDFANPVHQFCIVLITNFIFFIFLYYHPIANWNLHPPEGAYADNMVARGDVPSYFRPAKNFVKFGVFGDGIIPDYFRTIGYPAFLSGLMLLFGEHFFWIAYLIQAILSALTFSFITAIANFFVGNDQRIGKTVFIFLWLSGAYWVYFPMMMTEVLFCFFLVAGIYYGIKAVSEKKWKYCIIHLLFIGYAASVRPSLALYIVPEFFILLYLAVYFKTILDQKIKVMIGVATVLVFVLTSLSGFRNYINYGNMQPSSVLAADVTQPLFFIFI